jgi:hypothetical protein
MENNRKTMNTKYDEKPKDKKRKEIKNIAFHVTSVPALFRRLYGVENHFAKCRLVPKDFGLKGYSNSGGHQRRSDRR